MTRYVVGYNTTRGFVVLKGVENVRVALALCRHYSTTHTEKIVVRKRIHTEEKSMQSRDNSRETHN